MVRIEEHPSGIKELRITGEDIETPWNPCPDVFWAETDWLQNYSFGKRPREGEFVVKENQPDNVHRSWWQGNHSLAIIRELCKNQQMGYMEEKLDKLHEQVTDMITRYHTDREEFMTLTDRDRSIFGTFNTMAELHVEPLFESIDQPETKEALRECMRMTKAIGIVPHPAELLPHIRRCRTAVEKVYESKRKRGEWY